MKKKWGGEERQAHEGHKDTVFVTTDFSPNDRATQTNDNNRRQKPSMFDRNISRRIIVLFGFFTQFHPHSVRTGHSRPLIDRGGPGRL